jgi:hypothetical protein
MKRIAVLLISILLVHSLYAQDRLEILTLSGRYTTPQPYDPAQGNFQAQESGSFVALTVPIPINKKNVIYTSVNYFYFHVNHEADNVDPVNLHGTIVRTGLIRYLNNGQSIQLLFAPRFMTDAKGGGFDNLQLGGLAMYQKVFGPKLTMGFGAMYNNDFFGPYLVPLINLDWKITEKFGISGLLPIYSKIKYMATDKLTVGICHFGLTMSFGLNDPDYETDYMQRNSIDVAGFVNYQVIKNVFLELRIGQATGRVYEQYDQNDKIAFGLPLVNIGDNRVVKNAQFENGLFGELRLIYSIMIPD